MKLTARYPEPSLGSGTHPRPPAPQAQPERAHGSTLLWVQNLQEELWESSALTFVQQSKAEGFGSLMPSWPNWLHGTSLENEEWGTPGGFYPLKCQREGKEHWRLYHPVYMCWWTWRRQSAASFEMSCGDILGGQNIGPVVTDSVHHFLKTELSFLLRYNLLPSVTLQDQRPSFLDRCLLQPGRGLGLMDGSLSDTGDYHSDYSS